MYRQTTRTYSALFSDLRDLRPDVRHEAAKRIPFPFGTMFAPRSPLVGPNLDRDRLHLSPHMAMRRKRIYGLVASILPETKSANTRWGRGFFRTSIYSASYFSRAFSGDGPNIALWDAVVGAVEDPHSANESDNLIDRDHAPDDDWRFRSPFSAFAAAGREHLLFPDVLDVLPQIGGRPYAELSRFPGAP